MRRLSRRLLAAWVAVVSLVVSAAVLEAGTAAASDHDGVPRVDEATLDDVARYLEGRRSDLGLPGLAAGIVHGDQVVFLEGFGHTRRPDGAPVTPTTPFLIASISKPLTATAVMQLAEAGSVDLDAPVGDYLPELDEGGDVVTVRDLLHHRSGLSTRVGNDPTSAELEAGLEDHVGRLGPSLRPDAPYEYSNANYDVLALIVERVSGIPFARHMRERVFAPLEMDRSFLEPDRAVDAGMAQGHYHWLFRGYRPHDAWMPAGLAGSVTMFSSAEDLTHVLIAHLNGGAYRGSRILSERSVRSMHEPVPYEEGMDRGYALGWHVQPAFPRRSSEDARLADLTLVSHDGAWPTYRGVMWMVPETDLGFVMLANGNDMTDETRFLQVGRGVRAILFGLEPSEITSGSPLPIRWSKLLALALVGGQLALGLRAVPIASRVWRGDVTRRSERLILASASGLDVVVVAVLLWMPTVFNSTLAAALGLPDFRVLLIAAGIALAWGAIRAAAVGMALLRHRRTDPPDAGIRT